MKRFHQRAAVVSQTYNLRFQLQKMTNSLLPWNIPRLASAPKNPRHKGLEPRDSCLRTKLFLFVIAFTLCVRPCYANATTSAPGDGTLLGCPLRVPGSTNRQRSTSLVLCSALLKFSSCKCFPFCFYIFYQK